jgi:hypothetical protein
MRLVVEEAQDHSTCMEIVRQRHGADCVVVHSFRVEDQYRIVVALETETTAPAVSALTDAVRDVIAPAVPAGTIKWDTFIDDVSELTPAPQPMTQSTPAEPPRGEVASQPSPAVSSGLIALAARIKALEAAHQPTILAPETEEFRAVVFSDVLASAVASDTPPVAPAQKPMEKPEPLASHAGEPEGRAPISPLEIPMIADKDPAWAPSPEEAFAGTVADEPVMPRVCTSEGAENFATLLSGCIAVASKSMSLSGQTQLKIAAGQGI